VGRKKKTPLNAGLVALGGDPLGGGVGAGTNPADAPLVAVYDPKIVARALMEAAAPDNIKMGSDYDESDIPGFVSTGISPLDFMLAEGKLRGGLPRGRFIEIFGPEGSSKSSLGLEVLVSTQRGHGTDVEWEKNPAGGLMMKAKGRMRPGIAVLNDTERSFSKQRFSQFGGDPDALLYFEGATIEQGFDSIIKLLSKAPEDTPPITFLWDTVSASPVEAEIWDMIVTNPKATDDEDDEDEKPSGRGGRKKKPKDQWSEGMTVKPRKMRSAFRRVTRLVAQKGALVIFVSQTGTLIGRPAFHGVTPEEATGSGRAIKFASTLRLKTKRGAPLRDELPGGGYADAGTMTEIVAVKSKTCAPWRTIVAPYRYDGGFDDAAAVYEALGPVGEGGSGDIKTRGSWKVIELGDAGGEIKFYASDWRELLNGKPEVRTWANARMAAIYSAPAVRRPEFTL
jgi:recombination protein RecA